MNNRKDLKNKVAFITGASRNLGREIALDLAARGANIVIHYHSTKSETEAKETLKKVTDFGVEGLLVSGDLSPTNLDEIFLKIKSKFGALDILVNNAGTIVKKPISEISEEDYDRVFAINSKAAFFAMQKAANILKDNGRIVNIGTTLTGATTGMYSVYAGSKAVLEHFSKALAKEVGHRGITVNTVAPGPLNTSFFFSADNDASAAYVKQQVPLKRMGELEDIVPLVGFLTSEESRWITGQTIFANGGYLAK